MNPRVLDAVNDVFAHLAFNHQEERAGRRSWADAEGGWHPGVELLVIDVEGAFLLVPLAQGDQRYIYFKVNGSYWVYLCTAQGSRTAPIPWGRIAGHLCRLTQGVFSPNDVRINMLVDDPILSLRGNSNIRRFHAAMFILLWRPLGFPLAFVQASMDKKVDWIRAQISIVPRGVRAVRSKTSWMTSLGTWTPSSRVTW